MIIYSLEDMEFYKKLSKRKDRVAKLFTGLLIPMTGDASEILEFVRKTHPSFTSHNIQHSWRILNRIEAIITQKAQKQLSSLEIVSFIIATAFHDVGMINDKMGRKEHHLSSEELTLRYLSDNLTIVNDYLPRLAKSIGFIIRSHGLSWESMTSTELFKQTERILEQKLRVRLLSVFLRLGDLLDLDSERICDAVRQYAIGDTMDDTTIAHHLRHKKVTHFYYNPDHIEISVNADSKEEHMIWSQWLGYIEKEILHANTYVFRDGLDLFSLPAPNLNIKKAPGATYNIWPLRFEIDEKGKLWDVISKSIYTKRFDFIREVIQNAIDATLSFVFNMNSSKINGLIPRLWSLEGYRPCVIVSFSEKQNTLTIIDNGIGMDKFDLQNFLFRVAETGYSNKNVKRDIAFPSIAKFGIGFVSCLVRANTIYIYTKSRFGKTKGSASGHKVVLQTHCSEAYSEKDDCPIGTRIKLVLKKRFYEYQIRSYIENTFKYPSVPLLYIDDDEMEDFVQYASQVCKNAPSDATYKLSKGMLYRLVCKEGVEFFEKTYEHCFNLTKAILQKKSADDRTLSSFGNGYMVIPTKKVYAKLPKKPYYFHLDRDLKIKKISHNLTEARNKLLMIWIPVRYINPKIGIEWASLHGFLVNDSKITKSIVRYTGLADEFDDPDRTLIMSIENYVNEDFSSFEDDPIDLVDIMRRRRSYQSEKSSSSIRNDGDAIWVTSDTIVVSDLEDYIGESKTLKSYELKIKWSNTRNIAIAEGDLSDHKRYLNNHVYQDGIEISVKGNTIVPVGACRSQCNLTGNSRFDLNVSRNAINESPTLLAIWAQEVGAKIQQNVVETVLGVFQKCNILFDTDSIFTGKKTADTVSEYTNPVLKNIIRDSSKS